MEAKQIQTGKEVDIFISQIDGLIIGATSLGMQ